MVKTGAAVVTVVDASVGWVVGAVVSATVVAAVVLTPESQFATTHTHKQHTTISWEKNGSTAK